MSIPGDMFECRNQELADCIGDLSFVLPLSSPANLIFYFNDSSWESWLPAIKDTLPSATAQVGEQQNNDFDLSLQCTTATEPATATVAAGAGAGTDRTPCCTSPNVALVLEKMGLDRPEQQPGLSMECDAALTLNNGGGGGDNNNLSASVSVASANAEKPNKTKRGGPVTGDTCGISISLEQLEQLFEKPREEAADILGVRKRRTATAPTQPEASSSHHISTGPTQTEASSSHHISTGLTQPEASSSHVGPPISFPTASPPSPIISAKKNNGVVKKVSSSPRNCTRSRGLDPKKLVAVATTNVIQTSPPPAAELAMKDARLIIFKANCENFIIRFELPSTLKMVDVEQQVAKRLGLKMGSFNISYLDEYNDWVLITCDDDLRRLLHWTTIRILVTPSSKLINLTSEFNLISTSFVTSEAALLVGFAFSDSTGG
ncbi:hypothetical protein LguiA_022302 [Lonicera macranthoides]